MKKLFVMLFAAAMLLGAAGCTAGPQPAAGAQTLRVGAREIAEGLDPVGPLTAPYLVNMGAGELLFKADPDGIPQPFLAESARQCAPVEWRIKLREGVTFWSGKAVDADAVLASLARSRQEDLKAQPFLQGMTFEKVDDHEIRVTTVQPDTDVPLNLSYFQLVIHNTDAAYDTVENMDLTGMYRPTEYIPGQKMTLVRQENYWGEKPAIETVVHEQIPDEQARVAAALSGEYQVVMNIPVSSVTQFEGNQAAELVASEATNTETIYLNLRQPPFQDQRVRQALSWALDRDALITLGAEGIGKPVTTWLGSNPQYAAIRTAVYDRQDTAKADALLNEAGWLLEEDGLRHKNGEVLKVELMTWGVDQALGEAIQAQWREIGIDAQVRHGDYSLIEAARETGRWDALIEAWSTYGDVAALLKGQYAKDGGGNYGGYQDQVTDQWFQKIDAALSAQARTEAIQALSLHVAQQSPVICLYPRPELTAVNKHLHGFTPHFRQFENVVTSRLTMEE